MQRTYDQLSQDLCINNNPATILVNGASVYGMNDITHLGLYDIPMISNIPNMVYLAPTSKEEYFAMLDWSIEQTKYPVAIRIPCNGVISDKRIPDKDYSNINKYKVEQKGNKVAMLALGDFYQLGEKVVQDLKEKLNMNPTLINPRFITKLDEELLENLKQNHEIVITLEDGILDGGFGEKIARFYNDTNIKVKNYGIKKAFYDKYNVNEVLQENKLTPEQIEETTGITVAASPAREKKLPFYIAPGKLDEVELTDTCMISELTNRINELCDEEGQKNRKKLTAAFVNTLLIQKGYIEEATEGEEKVKHITEKGKEAGIQEEERYGKYGRKYYALIHTRESQEMILGELREYLADLTDE